MERYAVTRKKTDFDNRIIELHGTAGRIAEGLKDVLDALNSIADGNSDFLDAPDKSGKERIYAGAIFDAVNVIRSQIEGISKISGEFADHIYRHGNEIVELNKQLEETKKDAMLDPLTGIANRRRFEQALETFLNNSEKLKGQLALLMSDVDDFKIVNDKLGHQAGDQVLKLVARAFIYNLKNSDFVGRWGGDEFTAILTGTSHKNAGIVGERIRSMLAKKSIQDKSSGETLGKITLSIGIASLQDGDTVKTIVARADEAMYRAKHNGKNKVIAD